MSQLPGAGRAPPRPAVAGLAILAATLVAYAGALHGAFVFDDLPSIRNNPVVRDLAAWAPWGVGWAQRPGRGVAYLSFALNQALGGFDVAGFHAVNVLVHAANALLVYALVVTIFRTGRMAGSGLADASRAVALAAALLFATHPLQTQAVAYVVQRITSLAAFFYLLTVVAYARWRLAPADRPAWRRAAGYAPVLVAAVLAMNTKEISFTLPFAVALLELLFLDAPARRRAAWLAPLFATALLVPLAHLGAAGRPLAEVLASAPDAARVQTAVSRWDYLTTQLVVIVRYLGLLLLPVGQNIDHDQRLLPSIWEPKVLGALAVIVALGLVAAHLVRRTSPRAGRALDPAARLVSFGIAWFFLALSVESSVIPIVDLMNEHRVYLPSAGFFAAVAAAGGLLARKLAARPARLLLVSTGVLSAILAVATISRNRVWESSLALWSDSVEKSPNKTRPHSNLGLALVDLGRHEEALAQFQAVVEVEPNHVSGYNNLAVQLSALGKKEEAARWLGVALGLKPDHAETLFNLGRLRLEQGRNEEAAELLGRATALDPGYVGAWANLGGALNQLGRPAETVRLLGEREALLRDSPEARFNLGVAYVLLGDGAGAVRMVSILSRLAPDRAAQLGEFVRARGLR